MTAKPPTPQGISACSEPARDPRDVIDRLSGKVRVLSSRCGTCIFRPGNPLGLAPDRTEDVIRRNVAAGALLTCHSTGPYPDFGPAVCAGFWARARPGDSGREDREAHARDRADSTTRGRDSHRSSGRGPAVTDATRIRWEDSGDDLSTLVSTGFAGTLDEKAFKIYGPDADHPGEWLAVFQLSIADDRYLHCASLAEAKELSEQMLARFVASVGAVFRGASEARWEALKDHLGRLIEHDQKARQGALRAGETHSASAYGSLISANETTLAKMRGLEAGQ